MKAKKYDPEFTKLLGNHMLNAKGFLDWGLNRGLTSPQDLRLTIAKRIETVKVLKDSGMSQRKIAKAVGVSRTQVQNDLGGRAKGSGHKVSKNGHKVATHAKTGKQKSKVEDTIPDGPGDSDEVVWRRGLLYRAREAFGHAAFEDWSKFKVDSELVEAARQAAEAWGKLAAYLETLYGKKKTAAT